MFLNDFGTICKTCTCPQSGAFFGALPGRTCPLPHQLKLYQTDKLVHLSHPLNHHGAAPLVRADFPQLQVVLQLRTRPTGKEFHWLALNSNLQEPTNSTLPAKDRSFLSNLLPTNFLDSPSSKTDIPAARSSAFRGSFESVRCFWSPAGGHWQNVDVLGQNERGELHYAHLVYLRGSDLCGE